MKKLILLLLILAAGWYGWGNYRSVLERRPSHGHLQRMDLGEDHRVVEDAQDFGQAAHDEHVGRPTAVVGEIGHPLEPLPKEARSILGAAPDDLRANRNRIRHDADLTTCAPAGRTGGWSGGRG